MIWSLIQVIIVFIVFYISADAYIYYFGWIKYDDEEKERKRQSIVEKNGLIILLCAILMDIIGFVLLYLHLPVLMYSR